MRIHTLHSNGLNMAMVRDMMRNPAVHTKNTGVIGNWLILFFPLSIYQESSFLSNICQAQTFLRSICLHENPFVIIFRGKNFGQEDTSLFILGSFHFSFLLY